MKIIGQSTIIATPPYLHLGYLATTVVKHSASAIGAGLSLIAVGVVLGFWVKRSGQAWLTGQAVSRRRSIAYGITGFCLVCAGIYVLVAMSSRDTGEYAMPEQLTRARLVTLHSQIMDRRQAGVSMPDSIHELIQNDPESNQDAWGTELKIEPFTIDGVDAIRVISAGPDTWFGTPDDIVFPREKG